MALDPELQATLEEAGILGDLDEKALGFLRRADPDRGIEIVNEMMAKGHIRNPSAFVSNALGRYPKKRGREGDVDEVLSRYPQIMAALDEKAMAKLKEADPARAVEIIEDLAAKGDVKNPSAFVSNALHKFPHKRGGGAADREARGALVEEALSRYPEVAAVLDERSLTALRQADQGRAVEIIEDVGMKGDIRNPSAFVCKALREHPHKRTRLSDVDNALQKYPQVAAGLDDNAMIKLRDADPGRAVEIIEDLAAKDDVRNPSAFVATALQKFPHKRGVVGHNPPMQMGFTSRQYEQMAMAAVQTMQQMFMRQAPAPRTPRGGSGRFRTVEEAFRRYPAVRNNLDDGAIAHLRSADQERALEVIEDLISKGDVRNPSAFVAAALSKFPHRRGPSPTAAPAMPVATRKFGGRDAVDDALSRYPRLRNQLDDKAIRQLREVSPGRAAEVIEDVGNSPGIRNPSAFVSKALGEHQHRRGGGPSAAYGAPRPLPTAPLRKPSPTSSVFSYDSLDDSARAQLDGADPARAAEILEELAAKGRSVRNPSAFVAKAVQQYPQPRGKKDIVPRMLF